MKTAGGVPIWAALVANAVVLAQIVVWLDMEPWSKFLPWFCPFLLTFIVGCVLWARQLRK